MSTTKFVIDAIFKASDKLTEPLRKMGKGVDGFVAKYEKRVGAAAKINDGISSGLKKAGALAAGVGLGTAAIIKDIVDVGATFDKTLVGAAAKFNPEMKRGTAGFEALRIAAEKTGADTEFNAQQGAEALKSLASAGFNAEQAIATLPKVVDLATASEVDLGAASEMATKALGAFGLQVEDSAELTKNLTKVTDVMAYASGKTKASMEGLFESIKEGAPVAVATGQSMETFMAMASKLADAGIEGSTAGTTLKNVFLSLSAPTAKAAGQLKKLGVKTKDSKGNLRDVVDIMADLETSTKKLGTADKARALENIFGKIPIAGVSSLLDQGAESIRKLRKELEGAEGSTEKMAKTMRDTVTGDIDGFTSAIDGVKVALFSANTGPIRDVIQSMTEWVKANKDFIVINVGNAVEWLGKNLGDVVKWLERIAIGVGVFYTMKTAIEGVNTAMAGWKLLSTVFGATKGAVEENCKALDCVGENATKAGGKLAGMRAALNATGLAKSINGVTSALGKGGLLGAAFLVGGAIGTVLNETFGLDEKISGMISKWAGNEDAIDKAGGRAEKPGIQEGGDQYYSDGSIRRADGSWKYKSPARVAKEQKAAAAAPQVVTPAEQVAKSVTETTETTKAEVTIKDQTGTATITKKPRKKGIKLHVQPTGGF